VIANPLNDDEPLMRTMVLPGLLRVLVRNIGRGFTDVGCSRPGTCSCSTAMVRALPPSRGQTAGLRCRTLATLEAALPEQPLHIAAVVTGDARTGRLVG